MRNEQLTGILPGDPSHLPAVAHGHPAQARRGRGRRLFRRPGLVDKAEHAGIAVNILPVVGTREHFSARFIRPVGSANVDDVDRAVPAEGEELRRVFRRSDLRNLRPEVVRLAHRAKKRSIGANVPCSEGVDGEEKRIAGKQRAVFRVRRFLASRPFRDRETGKKRSFIDQIDPA